MEIVSCDAFQVYRELDIGSAKPPAAARRSPPHHLFDVLAPDDACSAGRYAGIAAGGDPGTSSGGEPFRWWWEGAGSTSAPCGTASSKAPRPDPRLRRRLLRLYQRPSGPRLLKALLHRLDPAADRRIHPNDRVRRVRALEVVLATGEPISRLRATRRPPLPGARWCVAALSPPRPVLDRRIGARVAAMFAEGLVEEVRGLEARYPGGWPGRFAIGYREVAEALAGVPDTEELRLRLREAGTRIEAATRRYARRQLTWFRAERGVRWHEGTPADPLVRDAVVGQFQRFLGAGADPEGPPQPRGAPS